MVCKIICNEKEYHAEKGDTYLLSRHRIENRNRKTETLNLYVGLGRKDDLMFYKYLNYPFIYKYLAELKNITYKI